MGQFEFPGPPGPRPMTPPPQATWAPQRPRQAGDPVLPHLIWEAVLLIGAVCCLVVLFVVAPSGGSVVTGLLTNAAVLGLVASGVAVSLRTAAPNLAVGALAGVAGLLTAHLVSSSGWSVPAAGAAAVVVTTLIGLVLGGITALASVPGWAVTFGAGVIIQGIVFATSQGQQTVLRASVPTGGLWFALFCLITLGGGGAWLVPAVRRTLSAGRADGDPAVWRLRAAFGPLVGLTISGLLAGLAGVLQARQFQSAGLNNGLSLLPLALGAALLGGVSIFGRRAGITGTLFAVLGLSAIQLTLSIKGAPAALALVVAGIAIVVGLGVSRLLELIASLLTRRKEHRPVPGPTFGAGPAPVQPPGITPPPAAQPQGTTPPAASDVTDQTER